MLMKSFGSPARRQFHRSNLQAQCHGDCSSSAQSLQRKDEKISGPLIQRMSWMATRPLGQKEGKKGSDWNIGFGNLKVNHRHIIFSDPKVLPTGNQDNIGFHCTNGKFYGAGGLFSEPWRNFGYTGRDILGKTAIEDQQVVDAVDHNNPPGDYNLVTHNCQDWVDQVRRDAHL